MKTYLLILCASLVIGPQTGLSRADSDIPVAPDASKYEVIWKANPFVLATVVAEKSEEYALNGVAQIQNVSFASILCKQNSEQILLTSETPVKGLKLISVSLGHDKELPSVIIETEDKTISLQMENSKLDPSKIPAPTADPAVATAQ